MILDGTLKDGEYKFYEDLGNGWAEEIKPPISAYGSINVDELNQVIERLGKCPNFDELIKDNNKKDKEIQRLNKYKEVLDKIKEYIKESIECSKGVLSNPEHVIVGKHELIKLEIENYKKILELLEEIK